MGFKDTKWAYTLDELTASQVAVLVALCHMTDDKTHQTYASQKTLASMAKVSLSTVNTVLGVLATRGIITRTRRNGVGGFRTTDIITAVVAYVGPTYVGETNIGVTNVGLTGNLHPNDGSPTSGSWIAEEINQIDQPEDQPVNALEVYLATSIGFIDFWTVWPRKESKKAAAAAWERAAKRDAPATIYDAAVAYAKNPHRPARQFIPHAATWLNGDRWNDPLPEAPESDRVARADRNLDFVHQLQLVENSPKGIAS